MIHPFDTNPNLTPEQQAAVAEVRAAYKILNNTLSLYVHPGHELSIAITNLETSAMWAVKAITHA